MKKPNLTLGNKDCIPCSPNVSCCLLSQVALLLKIFSLVTFTVLHISFVNIKGYFDLQKPSHVTFSPRFFFFYSFIVKFSIS